MNPYRKYNPIDKIKARYTWRDWDEPSPANVTCAVLGIAVLFSTVGMIVMWVKEGFVIFSDPQRIRFSIVLVIIATITARLSMTRKELNDED